MAALTTYAVNKFLVDNIFRGQANPLPTAYWFGLFIATKGYAAVSTAYTVGDTVVPATPNGHMYKCTASTAVTGGAAPAWPTTPGSTVTDGGVTWTEQGLAITASTFTEASYTGYARITQAASLANFAGTQGAGSVVASSGASGQTSNNNLITFGAPTSAQSGIVVGMFLADAVTAGNIIVAGMLANPKTINNGDAAPSLPASTMVLTYN